MVFESGTGHLFETRYLIADFNLGNDCCRFCLAFFGRMAPFFAAVTSQGGGSGIGKALVEELALQVSEPELAMKTQAFSRLAGVGVSSERRAELSPFVVGVSSLPR